MAEIQPNQDIDNNQSLKHTKYKYVGKIIKLKIIYCIMSMQKLGQFVVKKNSKPHKNK